MTPLAALLAMDEPVKPSPRFTIEPSDKGDASELARQIAFRRFMASAAPSVLVYANTNGTHIATQGGRYKANAEGRTKGVPDVTVVWNHGVAWLEWKAGKGTPSNAQIELGNRLVTMGQRFAVVRSVDFAAALLREWGAPVRAIRS